MDIEKVSKLYDEINKALQLWMKNKTEDTLEEAKEYSDRVISNAHLFGNSTNNDRFYSDKFNETYEYNMAELKVVNPIQVRELLSYLRATKKLLAISLSNNDSVESKQFVKANDKIICVGDFGYTNAEHARDILITYKNKAIKLEPKWKIVARAILRNAEQKEATSINVIIAELEQHNTRGTTYDNIRIYSTVCKINDRFYRVLKRRPIEVIHEKGYLFYL
jgi:hypothetical protein